MILLGGMMMNSAIVLRTKTEINHETLNPGQRNDLIKKMSEGKMMQKILSWQMEDGYFNERMHTPVSNSKTWSQEGCIRYLMEMGLTIEDEPIKKAFPAMLKSDWGKELTATKSVAAEEFGYGVIRAALFAQAGLHYYDFVKYWIDISLKAFRCILEVEDYHELLEVYRNKFVFKAGIQLPNIYHLRILAYTQSWRTRSNMEMLQKAYEKLYQWLPLPAIYIKAKSQLVAPAFTIAQSYNKDLPYEEAFLWLQFYELSARMRMLDVGSPFYQHFHHLVEEIVTNGEEILDKVNKRGFFTYSGYSGLALSDDWRSKEQKRDDLMFRLRLIDTYTKIYE
jgi:hypothetical protein